MAEQVEKRNLLLVTPPGSMPELKAALDRERWALEVRAGLREALLPLARRSFAAMLVHEDAFCGALNPLSKMRRLHPELLIVALLNPPGRRVEGADECLTLPCEPAWVVRVLAWAYEAQRHKHLLEKTQGENRELRARVLEQKDQLLNLENAWGRLSGAASDLHVLFKTAVELFCDATGAGRLSLMLLEKNGPERELRIVEAQGLPEEIVTKTRQKLGEGVAGWVAEHGRSLLNRRPSPAAQQGRGVRFYTTDSFLSMPLKIGGEVLGVVNMTEGVADGVLGRPDVKALSVLAEQTAVWIRYCERLEQARRLSLIDELTSLYNRRYFGDALKREIGHAERTGEQLGLAMLDIDHFKLYNDAHGHQAGDRLLQELAGVLRDNVRSTDMVCRYGGEEFAIILPETGRGSDCRHGSSFHFMNRLRAAVAEFPFEAQETQPRGRLTVSAGVGVFPDDADNSEALIAVSDELLYEAKKAGRNRVCSRGLRRGRRLRQKIA